LTKRIETRSLAAESADELKTFDLADPQHVDIEAKDKFEAEKCLDKYGLKLQSWLLQH